MVIQVPHAFANQITDPSCWTDHLTHANNINLTVLCPCNNDENDVRPMCISTHNCPVIVEGLFGLYAYLKCCRKERHHHMHVYKFFIIFSIRQLSVLV